MDFIRYSEALEAMYETQERRQSERQRAMRQKDAASSTADSVRQVMPHPPQIMLIKSRARTAGIKTIDSVVPGPMACQ